LWACSFDKYVNFIKLTKSYGATLPEDSTNLQSTNDFATITF
jgi:hypothetical protein